MNKNVPETFGSMVFTEEVMREKLPKDVFMSLMKTIEEERDIDVNVANAVAAAMKDWAIEKGATHYTHWFQPMTGITAEKHDSFITPDGSNKVLMEFSGKELIKGEPDASSFPSGGLRATFEARGYTAWDPTSFAFIKDDSLCIPTAFYSYGGEVLDKKTPLLRSMEFVNEEALRILKLFGIADVKKVSPMVGPEQEYFLIDKGMYDRREDIKYTGRTLFGAAAPKGQELEDHYFGAIKPRVMAFMCELNEELWKLGIFAKTEHNEVAPAQHELAPIFTSANTATDHNQLIMEMMKKVALRHGMVCLLHEKPFEGVNGSGKHNNWSLVTDKGLNLFDPGKEPAKNKLFLLMISAVIKAVDKHQDLLRIAVASAGNDHRLGANEAPPAIVSMFLGSELTAVLEAVSSGKEYVPCGCRDMVTGVHVLPDFKKDTTDRNRTSPFAFTGNKFEFRMLGSAFSLSGPNIVINTAVADIMREFADRLEGSADKDAETDKIIKETYEKHSRIVFNGNNYAAAWVDEAEKRGLCNYKTAPEAIRHLTDEGNIELFTRSGIFTAAEIASRREILLETYVKTISIEAAAMCEMAERKLLPAMYAYTGKLAEGLAAKKTAGFDTGTDAARGVCAGLTELAAEAAEKEKALSQALVKLSGIADTLEKADFTASDVIKAMAQLRSAVDKAETVTAAEYWPYPTYGEILFSV